MYFQYKSIVHTESARNGTTTLKLLVVHVVVYKKYIYGSVFWMLEIPFFNHYTTLRSFLLRAPVLVAIALVEYGMKYHDAVENIRQ